MKKVIKRKGSIIVIVVLTIANIAVFLVTRGIPGKSRTADIKEELISTEQAFDEKMKADEGKRLLTDSLVMVNINGLPPFSFTAGHYLVIRFSEVNCETCVESIFSVLDKSRLIDSNRIILLADFKSEAYLRTFVRLNSIRFPIFKYPAIHSLLNADTMGYPYVFVIDDKGFAHDFFMPVKEDPERTVRYLERIKTIFTDKNISDSHVY